MAVLSDDNAAAGTFISRLTETSLPPDAASPGGLRGAVATGTDGALTAAVVAAASAPDAKPKSRPVAKKKVAEKGDDYPPPAKKVVKAKAPETHVDHAVHVVPADKAPTARARKAPAAVKAEPVAKAESAKARPAPKTKTAKAGDA